MNRPSLRTLVAVGLIAALGGVGGLAWQATHDSAPAAQTPPAPVDGSSSAGLVAAPSFRLIAADGSEVTQASLAGEVTLVGFFQPGCSSCIAGLRAFGKAARATHTPALAVNVVTSAGDLANFARTIQVGPGPTYAADPGGAAAGQFGIIALDTVLVLDARGQVQAKIVDPAPASLIGALKRARAV